MWFSPRDHLKISPQCSPPPSPLVAAFLMNCVICFLLSLQNSLDGVKLAGNTSGRKWFQFQWQGTARVSEAGEAWGGLGESLLCFLSVCSQSSQMLLMERHIQGSLPTVSLQDSLCQLISGPHCLLEGPSFGERFAWPLWTIRLL